MTDDEESSGLNSDAVIVDEFSMVDVMLLSSLLEQLRDDAKLIIVGDADQLPSVGAGNALADIISCGEIPVAKLTHIYRQDENGRIIVNAHKINAGEMPDLHNTGRDFFFLRSDSASQTADTVVGLVTERLPAFLNCDPLRIQVLCPMKSGDAGTVNLNRRLRAARPPTSLPWVKTRSPRATRSCTSSTTTTSFGRATTARARACSTATRA